MSLLSSSDANAPVSKLNGAVTALRMMLPMILNTTGAMRNCGSLSEPLIGRFKSITPWLSASSATARRTGKDVGAPSTGSVKVSWFSTSWLDAVSCPSGCTW